MKNGVFFTPSTALLVLALVAALAAGIYYVNSVEAPVLTQTWDERAYNEYSMTAQDVADIVNNTSGVSASVSAASVVFFEQIPNPHASACKNALTNYQQFSSNVSNETIFTPGSLENSMTLTVEPYGVNYTHSTYGGDDVEVNPPPLNITEYLVNIVTSANITSCAWTSPSGNTSLMLNVVILGSPGSCSHSYYVDPSQNSTINANYGNVTVTVSSGASLSVVNGLSSVVNVSTGIYLGVPNNLTGVFIPANTVITTMPQDSIEKNSEIRVF